MQDRVHATGTPSPMSSQEIPGKSKKFEHTDRKIKAYLTGANRACALLPGPGTCSLAGASRTTGLAGYRAVTAVPGCREYMPGSTSRR